MRFARERFPVDDDTLARWGDALRAGVPVIDTSDRRKFRRCRWQWDLESPLRQNLQPRQARPALDFGSAVHAALDACYGAKPYDYAGLVDHFVDDWTARCAVAATHPSYSQEQSDEQADLLVLGSAMLAEYARWAPAEDDFTVVATEYAGFVPIYAEADFWQERNLVSHLVREGELAGLYYYRTDGVVQDDVGRYWVMEHKTCARWWDDRTMALDEQVTSYCAAENLRLGLPIAGTMMNFLRKDAVEPPPVLKAGVPTTATSRLGSVTARDYREAWEHLLGEAWALRNPEARDAHHVLLERGHPTLRRELLHRSQEALEHQQHCWWLELRDMTDTEGVRIYKNPGMMTCNGCSAYRTCVSHEEGADWVYQRNEDYAPRPTVLV